MIILADNADAMPEGQSVGVGGRKLSLKRSPKNVCVCVFTSLQCGGGG